MNEFGFITISVTGSNGPGPITATGLKVGDRVLLCYSPTGPAAPGGMESVVTVDDQIQQTHPFNWTSFTFDVILLRGI